MSITEMLATTTSIRNLSTRSLSGTAQMNAITTTLVDNAVATIDADFNSFEDRFEASKHDSGCLDSLLSDVIDFDAISVDFLRETDEATLEGMLKSQQSKRSRCKSKTMDLNNYKALLSAAIAERLLRTAMNKPKGVTRSGGGAAITYLSDDRLAEYAADQEALKRELRNVQSKQSIMRKKADFNPEDTRYLALCEVGEQLKSVRITVERKSTTKIDHTKEAIAEILNGRDVTTLKSADSKELLGQIQQLLA